MNVNFYTKVNAVNIVCLSDKHVFKYQTCLRIDNIRKDDIPISGDLLH